MLKSIVVSGLALYYLVDTLLLRQRESHFGPFRSNTESVVFVENNDGVRQEHIQPVAFFDRIRSVFGVYARHSSGEDGGLWVVRNERAEVWTCPKCLSMWMALLFTIPFALMNFKHPHRIFTFHLAIAGISTALNFLVEGLMNGHLFDVDVNFTPAEMDRTGEDDDDRYGDLS